MYYTGKDTRVSQKFCNILVCASNVGSSVVIGVLTLCIFLHSMCDLKTTQMNMQHSIIQGLMLYEFKLGHNTAKATKNIHSVKAEVAVDHSTIVRWFKKFHLGCKNFSNQASSGRPKTMNSKAVSHVIMGNLESSTWRVSGEFSISQSSVVCHLHGQGKKHSKELNFLSHYQNIVKLLTFWRSIWKLLVLDKNVWNHITGYTQMIIFDTYMSYSLIYQHSFFSRGQPYF